jgi:DNA-directed RNA polymerase specialized sigma24 family protein
MMPMNTRRSSRDFGEQVLSKVYIRLDEQNINDIATELHMNVGTLKGRMRKATKD